MFSNPLFPSNEGEDEKVEGSAAGSLRQRRAKPPISIALLQQQPLPSSAGTGPGHLRKKHSKSSLLSPTTLIHSPPPCPPPSTPLPELPMPPSSAPLASQIPTKKGYWLASDLLSALLQRLFRHRTHLLARRSNTMRRLRVKASTYPLLLILLLPNSMNNSSTQHR